MSYTLDQATYRRLKTRLTTKQNKLKKETAAATYGNLRAEVQRADVVNAARAVVAEVDAALAVFEESGYPDSWASWERAKSDAELQLMIRGGLVTR